MSDRTDLAHLPPDDSDLDGMTDAELVRELEGGILVSARHLRRSARAYHLLRQHGVDVQFNTDGLAAKLLLIAENVVDAEVMLRLVMCGRSALTRQVEVLPPSEQRRLIVDEKPVEVAERSPDGDITHRAMKIVDVPTTLYRQVFGDRCIRSLGEQKAILASEVAAIPSPKDFQPVDLAALAEEAGKLAAAVREAPDRRAKRRAAESLFKVAEKITLLVR